MLQIRLSNEIDYQQIVAFQLAMAKETEGIELDKQIVEEGVRSVYRDPQKGKYYVAVKNEKIVGSLMLTPEWSDWRNNWVMWIQSVYIIPEMRRKGVFKKMYDHIVESVSSNQDVAGLRLYVDTSNINAINVYTRLGMNGDHYKLFEKMK